ncbi:sugar phosphate nucleotidyltransferase [Streptomyces sp. NPDC005281]|uniref:sugar phosphate nucleotidyltransferase n=1 Tax=Streptomyces sp. NPDC005281 TaxID=3155712 RepID=UPI00339E6205
MTDGVRAVLLAGGEGRRMGRLCQGQLKPLVPFGSYCRLIDFSLANAEASNLREVLLLSQYEERQLMDDLYRTWWRPGFRVHFGPFDQAYREGANYLPQELPRTPERGTADALIRKAPYLFGPSISDVLVLHADHVYRYDYGPMIEAHRQSGAALTLAYQRIERRYVHLFGMVEFDGTGHLTAFVEKPAEPTSDLVFAAFCVFDADRLHHYLEELEGTDWQHDISRDVIPAMLKGGERILGHEVVGHWEDIGTVDRYHRAHMALLEDGATLAHERIPRTIRPQVPRRFVSADLDISRSLVPDDLVNHGRIEHSVAFPGVQIGTGARVRRTVLLPGASVPAGADLDSAIVLEDGTVEYMATPHLSVGLSTTGPTGGACA